MHVLIMHSGSYLGWLSLHRLIDYNIVMAISFFVCACVCSVWVWARACVCIGLCVYCVCACLCAQACVCATLLSDTAQIKFVPRPI